MDVKSTWIPTWHRMDHVSWALGLFSKPPLVGRPNTKPRDHGTPNAHNCWFILLYYVWRPRWIEIHWNSIWLRPWSYMTSHYTWGSVTTLHDFGGVLGRPLDTFFWALTISWSQLLACVWSGPKTFNALRNSEEQTRTNWEKGCSRYLIPLQMKPQPLLIKSVARIRFPQNPCPHEPNQK